MMVDWMMEAACGIPPLLLDHMKVMALPLPDMLSSFEVQCTSLWWMSRPLMALFSASGLVRADGSLWQKQYTRHLGSVGPQLRTR